MDNFQCTEADWDHLIEFLDAYCSFDEPILDIFSMVISSFISSSHLSSSSSISNLTIFPKLSFVRPPTENFLIIHQVNIFLADFSHLCQIGNQKAPFFSPKSSRSLLGAYQDLKQSINKAFEIRPLNSTTFTTNKSCPLLASMFVTYSSLFFSEQIPVHFSRPVDSSIIEFDHRRNQHSINYIFQQNPLQFHLIIYTAT